MPSEEASQSNSDPPFTGPNPTTRLAPPHKKQRREDRGVSGGGWVSDDSPTNVTKSGQDVTGWSEERILNAVRDEVGKNLVSSLL